MQSTNQVKEKKARHTKIVAMVFFLICDIGLNSTLDYDDYNQNADSSMLLGLFGLQIVVQISVFLVLFLATADTFLFRVGLLGFLVKAIRLVLFIHPIYFALTVATGAYRINKLSSNEESTTNLLVELWKNNNFIALSFVQKMGKYTLLITVSSS